MPIYEFYCPDCHTIFKFFARRINTQKRPSCPKCERSDLERRVSLFAISKGQKDSESDEPLPDMDESDIEKAMEAMAGEIEGVDEDDPRQAARVVRKLYDATGLQIGAGMEEAIRRMEAGEDPDKIEAEMGDVLEQEDPFVTKAKGGLKQLSKQLLPPKHDDTLYDL